jgi:hypothetical protein
MIGQGKVEDFLVARIDPDDDDEPIVVMAWSDLAASIAQDGAEEAAVARLAEIGVEQSALREAMARKVVNQARIEAIREFRQTLANPRAAYAPVPVAGYLLQGEATVAPDRGILLDTSWRMHPAICGFISEAVHDGRLKLTECVVNGTPLAAAVTAALDVDRRRAPATDVDAII